MKRRYIGLALGAMMAMEALSLPSCGRDQKLVSIQIAPSSYTFLVANAGQTEQLTATGTFIHPPANKPLTGIATWKVDNGLVTSLEPQLQSVPPRPRQTQAEDASAFGNLE